MPLASIVITSFNQLDFLREAVASARSQLFPDYEIIVVDDASTDGSGSYLAAQHDLVVIQNASNQGRSSSRNRGWRAAQGKYVTFLDGDDLFTPLKLSAQIEVMECEPTLGMVFGDMQVCDRNGNDLPVRLSDVSRPAAGPDIFESLAGGNFIQTSAPLIPTAIRDSVGEFDESMSSAEDWHLWLRIAAQFPVRYTPVVVGKYRIHADNTSRQRTKMTLGNAVVRRWLIDSPFFARLSPRAQYSCCLSAAISLTKLNQIREARRVLAKAFAVNAFALPGYGIWCLTWLGAKRFSRLTDWVRAARKRVRPEIELFGI